MKTGDIEIRGNKVLACLRERSGLTRTNIYNAAGIDLKGENYSMEAYEYTNIPIPQEHIEKLAKFFNVSVELLKGETPEAEQFVREYKINRLKKAAEKIIKEAKEFGVTFEGEDEISSLKKELNNKESIMENRADGLSELEKKLIERYRQLDEHTKGFYLGLITKDIL